MLNAQLHTFVTRTPICVGPFTSGSSNAVVYAGGPAGPLAGWPTVWYTWPAYTLLLVKPGNA